MKVFFAILLVLSGASSARAAEPLAIMPQGDLSCRIEVTPRVFSQHQNKEGKPDLERLAGLPIVTTVQIDRVGAIRLYQLAWIGNRKTEVWRDEAANLTVQKHPRSGKILVVPLGGTPVSPLADVGPEAVSWIRPEDDQGDGKLDGRTVRHYRRTVELPENDRALYQAWIDPASGIPVALDDGTALYKFVFSSEPPKGPLVMPPEFQNALDRFRQAMTPPRRL